MRSYFRISVLGALYAVCSSAAPANATPHASGAVIALPRHVESQRTWPGPFAAAPYTIVNLSSLLGGGTIDFIPTAINNAGLIVGYDDETLPSGIAGAAYLINADLSHGVLGNTGNTAAHFVPVAVANSGKTIAGNAVQFGTLGGSTAGIGTRLIPDMTGPVVWTTYGTTSSHQNYRDFGDPPIASIASGNVPVGGPYYFGYPTYSATAFKTTGCAISDFSANAINDSGTVAGVGSGHAAIAKIGSCPVALPAFPQVANTATTVEAINSRGDVLVALTGSAGPAYGSYYLFAAGKYARVALPAEYGATTYYVDAVALADGDAVVGNVVEQAAPFGIVSPFVFRNGSSVDLNALLPSNSGWRLVSAAAINATGEIVGNGYYEGKLQGYLLHP